MLRQVTGSERGMSSSSVNYFPFPKAEWCVFLAPQNVSAATQKSSFAISILTFIAHKTFQSKYFAKQILLEEVSVIYNCNKPIVFETCNLQSIEP